MIAVIDYGMGNLRSVAKAIEKVGGKVRVTSLAEDLDAADKIVLPGVGSFRDAMAGLKRLKLLNALIKNLKGPKPYLGLCLGMQLLFSESEEGGTQRGLDIFEGRVIRFAQNLKVPQMGWNRIDIKHNECPLLKGVEDKAWMYFVHSY
ncbi:MAG: imidazole glycerol phosphate synthase subunit HisH, partial [Candidatus Omnitrophota bacterium]